MGLPGRFLTISWKIRKRAARFLIFSNARLPDSQEARGARHGFDNSDVTPRGSPSPKEFAAKSNDTTTMLTVTIFRKL